MSTPPASDPPAAPVKPPRAPRVRRESPTPRPEPATTEDAAKGEILPLVPLRDNVVLPLQMAPLGAGRPRSVAALERAVAADGRVILAVQRSPEADEVVLEDLWPIAVIATVGALRRLPAGGAQALVEGQYRVRIEELQIGDAWSARVYPIDAPSRSGTEVDARVGSLKGLFAEYVAAGAPVAPDVAVAMVRANDASTVTDIAGAAPDLRTEDRVGLLQQGDVRVRLDVLLPLVAKLVEVAQLRARIHDDVTKTINKTQREHILREQLRSIKKELSELEGTDPDEEEDLVARVEALGMPDTVKHRVLKDVRRLAQIPSASPEMGMVRTWVDWILDLPWGDPPAEQIDIARAQEILDEDHYGLEKVKDRIVEWLAVRQRAQEKLATAAVIAAAAADSHPSVAAEATDPHPSLAHPATLTPDGGSAASAITESGSDTVPDSVEDAPADDAPVVVGPVARRLQTPILCLVGPPGVGKTSLGRSIARALDRKFVRLSLGGIRDEAEIRGHRRTYIGALPGRILQSMRQAGTRNPVIMLDEIDKVGMDFRGDPSAALLEVLDPEQNHEFSDHYLEVAYDLSHVLFITTANIAETISAPLRDRMEVIRITGYTEQEKVGIAREHLVHKQLEQHGLDPEELTIDEETIRAILHGYTREAGVRQLDRNLAEIARKIPRKLAMSGDAAITVTPGDLRDYLGPQRFDHGEVNERDEVGAVTGVVVSEVGGDIITVEALTIEGRAELVLTGQIGNVMEESARAALSWVRVHGEDFGAPKLFFDNHAVHIHVPAGAIPKDGPSAGVTMVTALVSAASNRPVRRDLAMTGEVTLRGRVLPIGGVKDKLLAAHRAGLKTFVLPRKNMRDLYEVDKEILDSIEVIAVDSVADVLAVALLDAEASPRRRGLGFVMAPAPVVDPPPATLH